MLHPEHYLLAVWLYPKLLAFVYFFAFGAFVFQIRGLLGEEGILPVKRFLGRLYGRSFRNYPTLFWFNASDQMLVGVALLGTLLSLLVILGVYPALLLPCLFFLYLSIVLVGQDFTAFGWESLILEMTYYAILLSWTSTPNAIVWLAVNFFIFRFHFLAGVIKWKAHDPAWRDWTALVYHYQTQPIPNTQSYFAHKLPFRFQQFSTAMVFVLEAIVPFGIFGPEEVRFATFIALFGLQFFIWFTGNFAFLNHLTVAMLVLLIGDRFLSPLFGPPPIPEPNPLALEFVLTLAGIFLLFIQVVRVLSHFVYNPWFERLLRWVWPYFIAHWHAIFAHMTKTRFEVVVEGSQDGFTWKEYHFKHKPTELNRRPRRISPYHPRLDWMMWFLPFDHFEHQYWFHSFLERLQVGAPEVLKLMRHNPFPDEPPAHVRALLYIYTYTDLLEKQETGNWWKRRLVGSYSR